jgi:hypothetical protein
MTRIVRAQVAHTPRNPFVHDERSESVGATLGGLFTLARGAV